LWSLAVKFMSDGGQGQRMSLALVYESAMLGSLSHDELNVSPYSNDLAKDCSSLRDCQRFYDFLSPDFPVPHPQSASHPTLAERTGFVV
jgi:hypothetical protein